MILALSQNIINTEASNKELLRRITHATYLLGQLKLKHIDNIAVKSVINQVELKLNGID